MNFCGVALGFFLSTASVAGMDPRSEERGTQGVWGRGGGGSRVGMMDPCMSGHILIDASICWNLKVISWKSELESWKSPVGIQKPEVGNQKAKG